ncbi:conserved protein of unknown function [Pseudomonas sp. JV551A1]|uniref:Uncharacterized protein n=1 Tax=Pseudomonas inefficax TaxID=2078786 RepID=A0AAQ1SSS6_9PSED|nr:conserved protein of unknown function [Pseudomonas sp. JV551A1]SPO60098.1 conserved protein of unknown function [Pseudomonas inefficax]
MYREVNAVVHCFCPSSTDRGGTHDPYFMRLWNANQTTLVLDATVFYRLRNKVMALSRVNPLPQGICASPKTAQIPVGAGSPAKQQNWP